MVKKLMISFLLVMAYQNAFAISLVYKFNVDSSGPDLYACNAGIRHVESTYCYIRDNPQQTCEPALSCGPGQNCNISNCVCITGQGSNRVDQVIAKYTKWTDHGYSSAGPLLTKQLIANGNWQQLFTDIDAWNWELSSDDIPNSSSRNLVFNLTSELYNAEYFVDICYRGPRIDLSGSSGGQYAFSAATYGDDSFGELFPDGTLARYLELARLSTKAQVQCYSTPGNFNSPMGSWGPFLMNGQTINFTSAFVLATLPQIPKFCKIRFYYSETSNKPRANTTQRARMCTDTSIDEPSTDAQNLQL
ncbi:MAG: hypothetical protein KDD37_02725 [Bdellovibrionales bacterium]|nr:hypothetical protein [Bdellovibrionales bacterium]